MNSGNVKIRDLPWGALTTVGIHLIGAIVFITTVNVQLVNFKESTAKDLINLKGDVERQLQIQEQKIMGLTTQQGVMQTTLDTRGQYGMAYNEKQIKLEGRVDNLEVAVNSIKDNIQTIVDRIWDEKKPRGTTR